MKKILISVLIVLLLVMAYFAIFRGISIGSIKILSVEQISRANDELTQEISQTEVLMNSNYPSKTSSLDQSVSNLLQKREQYLDLVSNSTTEDLQQASDKDGYTVEFLLARLGRNATDKGVNLKYTISAGGTGKSYIKNINFTVSGNYIPIIEFIQDIEDDSKLGFRIRNFKLIPGGENLTASFLVTNVAIENETVVDANVSTNTQTNTNTDAQDTKSTDNQNTNNTDTQNENTNS